MGLKILIPVIIGVLLTTVVVVNAQGPPSSQGGAPLNQILSLLNDPNFGLPEIKTEVANIETNVGNLQSTLDDPTSGLAEIKAEIQDIDSKLVVSNTDLVQVKNDIQMLKTSLQTLDTKISAIGSDISFIKTTLIDPTFGLQEIKTEVGSIETSVNTISTDLSTAQAGITSLQTTLDDPTNGLAEIKAEIASIEGTVNALDLTPLGGIATLQETLDDPTNGLAEIKAEIASIEGTVNALDLTPLGGIATLQETLDDPDTGLPAIQTEILSLDLSGIATIQNILDDPNDDEAEPNNIQMIKDDIAALDLTPLGGIATIQSTLADTTTGLPAIKSETDKIQMAKDDIATVQTTLNNAPGGADPYTITIDHDISPSKNNVRNIVLGIFSECDDSDNKCPFTVDSIILRPNTDGNISHPSVILVCSDDLRSGTFAPNCKATLAGGGSLGVGAGVGFAITGEVGDGITLSGNLDIGHADFSTTLPIGFNQALWAGPNVNDLAIVGTELLGTTGVGSVNAKEFVTVILFDFSGRIVIDGERDPDVKVKAVIMDSLKKLHAIEQSDVIDPIGGICPAGTEKNSDDPATCDLQCTDSSEKCHEVLKEACYGMCTETQDGTFSASFESEFENPPIRNAVFTQNENQKSNTIPIVTQSPPFSPNNNQFADPPTPIAFGDISLDTSLVDDLIEQQLAKASSAVDLTDVLDIDSIPAEIDSLTSDFDAIILTLLSESGIVFPDPIAEINTAIGTISGTFTTLINELTAATSSISSISSSITGPDGLISKINGFGGTITTLTNSITSLTSGFSSIFGITLTDFVDDRMIEPSFVVTEIEEAEIETIATYDDTVEENIVNIPFQTASGQITPIEFVPPGFSSGINAITTGVGTVNGAITNINSDFSTITGFVTSITSSVNVLTNGVAFTCNVSGAGPSGSECIRNFGGCDQGGNVQELLIPPQCQVNADTSCTRSGFSQLRLSDLGSVAEAALKEVFGSGVSILCKDDAEFVDDDTTHLTCFIDHVDSHDGCGETFRGSHVHHNHFFRCPSGTTLLFEDCWEDLSFSCDSPYGRNGSICRYNPCPASSENYVLTSEINNNGKCASPAICPSNFILIAGKCRSILLP